MERCELVAWLKNATWLGFYRQTFNWSKKTIVCQYLAYRCRPAALDSQICVLWLPNIANPAERPRKWVDSQRPGSGLTNHNKFYPWRVEFCSVGRKKFKDKRGNFLMNLWLHPILICKKSIVARLKKMETSNSTMNLHMEMEGHLCAMRGAMNVMEERKKDKVTKMPNAN